MKRLLLTAIVLAVPSFVHAQVVIGPAPQIEFTSADHNATIPAGSVNAGQPVIAQYQAMLFGASADVATGTPIVAGPVIPKTTAVAQAGTTPVKYRLTFAQIGITTPACTALPCPQFTILLVAIGPGGTTARGVVSESDPFTAATPTPAPLPAAPANVKIVP